MNSVSTRSAFTVAPVGITSSATPFMAKLLTERLTMSKISCRAKVSMRRLSSPCLICIQCVSSSFCRLISSVSSQIYWPLTLDH